MVDGDAVAVVAPAAVVVVARDAGVGGEELAVLGGVGSGCSWQVLKA